MNILVPLAEGFEEIEAVSIIDILRRTDLKVTTTSLAKNPVTGSHGITVTADTMISNIDPKDFSAMILPGGMPGSENLKNSSIVIGLLKEINRKGGLIGAICAAPIVLAKAGLLDGKKATSFPGYEEQLKGARLINEPVVKDGSIITGKGAGRAIPFALEIVAALKDESVKNRVKNSMQVYWM